MPILIVGFGVPQFDWLCDVCRCAMSPTSSIYWVDLSFINNYKEPQLWLVLLRYNANVASPFPWVITYGIKVNPIALCRLRDTTHKVGPNEDIKNLSGGDYDTLIWLIVWCVIPYGYHTFEE